MGLTESGLRRLIKAAYKLLNLITFYTTNGIELRAWTVKKGTYAPKAAGKIHSDFEKGFIKAEVISYEDFIRSRSDTAARESGLLRIEGKDYQIQDGDMVYFRFKS
jgi:ribosome-binding ATPase YchF (GTP1/OBG family)